MVMVAAGTRTTATVVVVSVATATPWATLGKSSFTLWHRFSFVLEEHLWVVLCVVATEVKSLIKNTLFDLFSLLVTQVNPKVTKVESVEQESNDCALF